MIAVEHKYSRLVSFLHGAYEISGKFIHCMDKIYIIFPCISFAFIFHAAYNDLRIFQHFFCRILSVTFYADCKHKVLPFGRIHRLHNIRNENIVCRPSFRRCLEYIHKLLTCVMIKSHVVKYLGAAVEISSVIMKSFGAVSKPFKGRRRAL